MASTFVTSLFPFIILYGVFYGFGIGICYLTPLICAWEYFPNRRGMVSGIIVGGFGFGAFIFGFLSYAIVNPDNEKPTLEVDGGKIFDPSLPVSERAPYMIRVNAAIWACLALTAVLLVKKKKDIVEVKSVKDNESQLLLVDPLNITTSSIITPSVVSKTTVVTVIEQECYPTFKEALKHHKTWHITLMALLSQCQGIFVSYVFKSFGELNIPDDAFITVVGTIAAVTNGLSRSFWANLQDRFGYKPIYMSLLAIQICVGFSLSSISQYRVLYMIWIATSYFCLGGHFSITPTV